MKIILDTAENGIIVTTLYPVDDTKNIEVFETENSTGDDDFAGRTAVLWHLIDQLGWYGSKHDEKRIRVIVESQKEPNE